MRINFKMLLVTLLVFVGAGLIPALLIAHSNKSVFPTTLYMANGMLWIAIIGEIVCMISASSEKADNYVRGGGIIFMLALGGVLWWNLGGHWQLSREFDGAQASVKEADEERKKLEDLANNAHRREVEIAEARKQELQAQANVEKMQSINRDAGVRQFIATGVRPVGPRQKPPAVPSPTSTKEVPILTDKAISASAINVKAKQTPEDVRTSWNETLTTRAYVEAGVGILSLILLMSLWHMDFNGNGISDRIERLYEQRPEFVFRNYPDEYARLSGGYQPQMPARQSPAMSPAARAEDRQPGK